MPMTSDQIAQMTSMGQQQAMMGMQHSAMISGHAGQPFAPGGMSTGEAMMGRMTNMGASVGMPIMAAGAGLLGVDPMSLAMRGVFSGSMGGAALGLGAASGVGAGLMAAQYGGKQAFIGMQQQQQLNQALSSTYQFQGQTQRGFTMGESADIGQMMRQMAMKKGVGGEFTSMEQLTGLASSMGQMGMMRGVNDVREFSRKFSEMVKTVKEVATAFNTNLEEALQVTSGMRNAGIFKNQGQVAQNVATWAKAGGIATSEVMQSMQMGSQLSRMIGGRGAAGAIAGMKTMGQIGVMEQMGMLSEEQIYNLTGQTGAAGRQALASQQMQQSAQFLRSALGRRAVASMAGAGGHVDESSARAWESGGVGTGETMQMAYGNLGKVGRAGFIRNEGRLRGEVMARFGGNAGVAVMSQWLESRGMDPGGDRGLIMMSRRLGISTEEAEQQLKQYRMRDLVENRRADSATDAQMWTRIEHQSAGQGIQGIKKGLDSFKNEINNKIQQWGADLYTEGSNVLERWFNKITGQFITTVDRDIGQAMRDVLRGTDAASQRVWEERFGGGRGLLGQKYFGAGKQGIMGDASYQKMGLLEAAQGAGDIKRLKEGGYGWVAGARTDKQLQQRLDYTDMIQGAYREGAAGGAGLGWGKMPEETRQELRLAVAMGKMGDARGEGTMRQFGELLGEKGPLRSMGAGKMESAWSGASEKGRARMMGEISAAAGLGFDWRMQRPEMEAVTGEGFRTEMDRNQAIGRYMLGASGLGKRAQQVEDASGTAGTVAKWGSRVLGGIATLGIGTAIGATSSALGGPDPTAAFGEWAAGRYRQSAGGASEDLMRSAGSFMYSEKGRDLALRSLSRDQTTAERARDALVQRNIDLQNEAGGPGKMNNIQAGEYEANKSMLAASTFYKLMEETGGKPTEEQIQQAVRDSMVESKEDLLRRAQSVGGAAAMKQEEGMREFIRREKEMGRGYLKDLQGSGLIAGGMVTEKAKKYFGNLKLETREGAQSKFAVTGTEWKEKAGGGREKEIKEVSIGEAVIQEIGSAAEAMSRGDTEGARTAEQRINDITGGLTMKGKTTLAQALEGGGAQAEGLRKRLMAEAGLEKKLSRFKGAKGIGASRGALGATAEFLGISMDPEELTRLAKEDPEKLSMILGGKLGLEAGGEGQKQLKKGLEEAAGGKAGDAAKTLGALRGGGEFAEGAKKKDEEKLKASDPTYRALTEIKTALEPLKALVDKEGQPRKVQIETPLEVKDVSKGAEGGTPPASDERLKENLEVLTDPVGDTLKLRGVRFKWKDSGAIDIGLIAQDVQLVIPEAVHDGEDGFLRVEYHKVIPLLVEAIKELKSQVDDLHATVDELSADLGR